MDPLNDLNNARDAGVLLPYQAKWIADQATVKVCEKSRRVGLSWGEAADDTLYASSQSGDDVWYIGYNKDMAIEFVSDCAMWSRHYHLAASEMEEEVLEETDKDGNSRKILTYKITYSSGHRITALSSRPTNLRGKQGRVIIDEAAFHEDLAGLLKAAIALIMWGGSVRIISTHEGEDNPFNELIKEIKASKKPYSLHRITFDEALGQGLYKRICLKLGRTWSPEAEAAWRGEMRDLYGDDAAEELDCVPSGSAGKYLSRAIIESCLSSEYPVLRLSFREGFEKLPDAERQAETEAWLEENVKPLLDCLSPNLKTYYGMDFGRTGDLSVIWPLVELISLNYRTPFLVELRNAPFKQQEQILFYILDRLPRFIAGANDARGNGQYLAEVAMQRYGDRVQQVMLTQDWYRDNMPRLKSWFEDKSWSVPKDVDVMDDLRMVEVERGVPKVPDTKRRRGSDGKERHGDAAIAGALATFATSLDLGPSEYATVTARESFKGLTRGAW